MAQLPLFLCSHQSYRRKDKSFKEAAVKNRQRRSQSTPKTHKAVENNRARLNQGDEKPVPSGDESDSEDFSRSVFTSVCRPAPLCTHFRLVFFTRLSSSHYMWANVSAEWPFSSHHATFPDVTLVFAYSITGMILTLVKAMNTSLEYTWNIELH